VGEVKELTRIEQAALGSDHSNAFSTVAARFLVAVAAGVAVGVVLEAASCGCVRSGHGDHGGGGEHGDDAE